MKTLTLQSPAKLNFHLRILGKRKNGYHNLLTLFHRISLSDTIRIQKCAQGFELTTNASSLGTGENNLITKAYRLLQRRFPKISGVSVHLTKRIPLGGGLGGGSSNAAFFLLGMKRLCGLKISLRELLKMGKKLGADVPFFLLETREALAWGIGEKMQKIVSPSRFWFLLLISDKGLNTKKVYQNLNWKGKPLSLTKEKQIVKIFRYFLGRKRIREAAELGGNDLESSAFRMKPFIPKAIATVRNLGASFVRMTGSGPTVFALFSSRQGVENLAKKLKRYPIPFHKVICHSF